jgi:TPR repeat protein
MNRTVFAAAAFAALVAAPAIAHANAIEDCDRLAAHPSDPDKVGKGVLQKDVDKPAAIKVCGEAVKMEPNNPRLNYQFGRVNFYNGDAKTAIPYLRKAADLGHEQAQFVLGLIERNGSGVDPADPCKTQKLWSKAADAGLYSALVSYPRDVMKGLYADCKVKFDKAQIKTYLDKANAIAGNQGGYYERLLMEDLQDQYSVWAKAN